MKGKIYKRLVRLAMLFCSETVVLKKRQEAELEVAELKMLSFSLGVTRTNRMKNKSSGGQHRLYGYIGRRYAQDGVTR